MSVYLLIGCILGIEIVIFVAEVLLSSVNKKNHKMARANLIQDLDFFDLEKGYRTNISVFRLTMFFAYIILVILLYNSSTAEHPMEELILYILIGVLVYMISLINLKVFTFYSDYFVVGSPFHFFKKDIMIRYEEIEDFNLYRALYNSYYLRLNYKNSPDETIQFSAAYLPRNDLVIRIILNSKTGQNKDFLKVDEEVEFS